jgi:hypothetical protein
VRESRGDVLCDAVGWGGGNRDGLWQIYELVLGGSTSREWEGGQEGP